MTGSRTPLTVLTGFLGSGKTTLLRNLLGTHGEIKTAVLINEFGEIGLDHLLVQAVTETAIVLQNGCICCAIRQDVQKALRDLLDSRDRGDIPAFDRLVIETTGLADPVPILQTLASDPMLRSQVRLANVIATVDAVNGADQLDSFDESRRQVVAANRLVLTKTDLASAAALDEIGGRLTALNAAAMVVSAGESQEVLRRALLETDPFHENGRAAEALRWLKSAPEHGEEVVAHTGGIRSFSISITEEIDWTAFSIWLSAMVHRYGDQLLRVKGLLDIPETRGPVLLQAVQRYIHPPYHLDDWPDGNQSSRLIFIVKDLDPAVVRRSLDHALRNGSSQALAVRA